MLGGGVAVVRVVGSGGVANAVRQGFNLDHLGLVVVDIFEIFCEARLGGGGGAGEPGGDLRIIRGRHNTAFHQCFMYIFGVSDLSNRGFAQEIFRL